MTKAVPTPQQEHDRLKEMVQNAYNRHLKRCLGNKVDAWDLTWHHLRHFGLDDEQWEFVDKVLNGMEGAPKK